jgi:hypothetical protein
MQIFFFFEFIGLYNNRRNWNYRIHCIWIEQLLLEKYLSWSSCKILWCPMHVLFLYQQNVILNYEETVSGKTLYERV